MSNSQPTRWVLIRGLLRSQFHWKSFSKEMQSGLNCNYVYTVELAGNGYKSRLNTPAQIDDAVENLRNQLSFLEDTSTGEIRGYGLLGISLGGMLATRWAQLYPAEVERLVLINSSSRLSRFTKRLIPKNYVSILSLLGGAKEEKIEEFILDATSNYKEKWKPHLAENIEFLKQHPIKVRNFLTQLALSTQVDFKNTPNCPKLVLCSKADRLVHYTCSEDIAKAWNCEIKYHESAGHDLPLDDTDWIIQNLKK